VTAPPGAFEQVGDAAVRARTPVVEGEEDRRRVEGALEEVVYRATPRGDRGCRCEMPLEVVALKLVGGGHGIGEAARVPVTPLDYVMIQ